MNNELSQKIWDSLAGYILAWEIRNWITRNGNEVEFKMNLNKFVGRIVFRKDSILSNDELYMWFIHDNQADRGCVVVKYDNMTRFISDISNQSFIEEIQYVGERAPIDETPCCSC